MISRRTVSVLVAIGITARGPDISGVYMMFGYNVLQNAERQDLSHTKRVG